MSVILNRVSDLGVGDLLHAGIDITRVSIVREAVARDSTVVEAEVAYRSRTRRPVVGDIGL